MVRAYRPSPLGVASAPRPRTRLLRATAGLLGAVEVSITAERPDDALASPVELPGRRLWLWASPEGRTEPFDDMDREMLGTLAALGSTALTNAELYSEAKQQRDDLAVITASIGEGVCTVDRAGRITSMSPAGARLLGWADASADEGGVPPGTVTPRFLLDPARRAMALRHNVVSDDIRFERADGTQFPASLTAAPVDDDGDPAAAVIVFRDTSERRAFEDQLARHAFQDPLTRLANRRLLLDHLDHALLQAQRSGTRVAVLFGDLDCFKVVNDSLGHQVGDELLRVVADRLRSAVRPGDTLSRFGGDEFVVVLEGMASHEDAGQVAERIREALREPVLLSGGHEVVATMSIGMALSRPRGSTRDDLIHAADVAMYRAKQRGRDGRVAFFDEERATGRGRADRGAARSRDRAARTRSSAARWWCTSSPWSRWPISTSSAPRPWCAGTTPSTACWRHRSSSNWPRATVPSCPSGASCSNRPAVSPRRGWRRSACASR